MKPRNLFAFGFTTLMLSVGVQAQTWDSGSGAGIQVGNGTWSTAVTNWTIDSGVTRLGWTNGNAATFAGDSGGTAAVALSGAITVNNITRTGNNAVSVTASTGNTLAISGTVNVGTGSRLNFIGGVTGGVTGSLVKTGAGLLELNGNDATLAFSSVTLNGGALGVVGGQPLQSESLVLNAGAIGSTNSNVTRLFDGAVTVGGDIGFGAGTNAAFGTNSPLIFSNTINLGGATRTLTIGSDVSFNGAVSNGSIIKAGSGILNLGALSGGLSVTGGTVNLSGAVGGNVSLSGGNTLGLNGGIITGDLTLNANTLNRTSSVTASGNIQVTGAQAVNLVQPTFGVATTILSSGGTLTDTDDSNPANNFTINNSSSFRSAPVVTTTSNAVQVTIAAGAARTWVGPAGSPTLWNLNTTANWSGGDSQFLNGDAVTFDDTATPASPVTVAIQGLLSPSAVTFNNTTKAYTVTGATGNGITGSTGLIKNGTGVLRLGGAGSTFSGNVQVNAGSLVVDTWEALGATGKTIGIASGAAVNINGKSPSSVGRHYTWNIAGDGVASSGAITNSGGDSFNNAGIQNLQLSANASLGGTGRFDIGRSGNNVGTIQGNGFTLTKNGTNQVSVRGAASNITYVVNAGALVFEDLDTSSGSNTITVNGGILGTWAARTIANNVNFTAAGAVLRSEGGSGTWDGVLSLNGDVTFRATSSLGINGTVSGTGNITKDGTSALRVGTGGTTGDLGTRIVNFTAASRLEVNRSGSFTMANDITGSASFTSLGTGTTTLTGNNTFTGETRVIGGGTLSVTTVADGGGAGALGNGTGGANAWLRVGANSTLRITGTGTQTTNRLLWNDNTTGAESGTGIFDVVDAGASVVFSSTGGGNNQSLTKIGAGSLTLSRFITGTAAVTVGGGTLALTGANNYTGATNVNAGTLSITNALGNSTVSVANGATLINNGTIAGAVTTLGSNSIVTGTGTFSSAVTIGGQLNPGNSPGFQSYGSSLTLGSSSLTTIELGGLNRSTLLANGINHYDAINVSGLFSLDGTIDVSWFGAYQATTGDAFNLLDWGSINHTGFNLESDLNLPTFTDTNLAWDTSSFLSNGQITVIPEPSSALAGGLGFLALLLRRRRA